MRGRERESFTRDRKIVPEITFQKLNRKREGSPRVGGKYPTKFWKYGLFFFVGWLFNGVAHLVVQNYCLFIHAC